jgi:energy-converting hydrogenase A subunit M
MPQTITLTLPDNILQPAQRVAQATRQSVEELLVTALQAALPTLEGLPPDVVQHLVALESLDDQTLWQVMLETVPLNSQHQLHALLLRNQAGMLTDAEREQLAILQQQVDLVMLRKARAAVLLRFRGKRVPTLAELSQLAAMDQ